MLKDLQLKDIIYQKELLIVITSSSVGKSFYDKAIDSDEKPY